MHKHKLASNTPAAWHHPLGQREKNSTDFFFQSCIKTNGQVIHQQTVDVYPSFKKRKNWKSTKLNIGTVSMATFETLEKNGWSIRGLARAQRCRFELK
jgi:hypothetical protein